MEKLTNVDSIAHTRWEHIIGPSASLESDGIMNIFDTGIVEKNKTRTISSDTLIVSTPKQKKGD